ncbi:MAG TPA: alpha/beta family hydrolase [Terriglobales bacterium]|nr:alpha/beta family hydrolase [Terriglobales bacterium]
MPSNPQIDDFHDATADPPVRGFVHTPSQPNGHGLTLTHGAGSNAQSPLLIALANTFAEGGFTVLRCDLPFRQARRFGPPRPGDATRDRQGLLHAVAAMRKLISGRLFLGGHSYGGRQASMLAAEQPDLADGLLLLSYPLHPPHNPAQLRTQHLVNLREPALFIHGTRDPFGSTEEIQAALRLIPAETKLVSVEGAGHDLGFKAKAKQQTDLPDPVLAAFQEFFKVRVAA